MSNESATPSKDVQQIARMIRNAFEANKGKSFGLQKSLDLASRITRSTSWHAIKAAESKAVAAKSTNSSSKQKSYVLADTVSFIATCEITFLFEGRAYNVEFEYTEQLVNALEMIRLDQLDKARSIVQSIHEDFNVSMDGEDGVEIYINSLPEGVPLVSVDLSLIPFQDGVIGVVATGNTEEFSETLELKTRLDFDSLIKEGINRFDEHLTNDFDEFIDGGFKPFTLVSPANNTNTETLIAFKVNEYLFKKAYLCWKKQESFHWIGGAHFNGVKATVLIDSELKGKKITFTSDVFKISISISLDDLKLVGTEPLLACHRGICYPMPGTDWISSYVIEDKKTRVVDSMFCKNILKKLVAPHKGEIEILARQNNAQDFMSAVLTKSEVLDEIGWVVPRSGKP